MFYDKESGCWIDVTQVGSILYVNISGCGDLGIGFPSNFGGGTMGPWTVHPIAIDGVCYATRGYINTDGEPDTQMIPIPCNEDFDPNDFDNGNNSDFPWDGNTDWTDYNTDPLHNGAGTQTNTNDNSNNDDSVSTIGILKQTNAEKVIECVGETNLSPAQITWLNSNDPNIANQVKIIAYYINKSGCDVMRNIILDFMESPTLTFQEFADLELECYGIQNLLSDTDFTDALSSLVNYLNVNPNHSTEEGFEVSSTDGDISTNSVHGSEGGINLANGGNIIGGMHLHTKRGDNLFSVEDIYNLFLYANNNTEASPHDVFSILDTVDGTYMIKIRDISSLNMLFQFFGDNQFKKLSNFRKKLGYKKGATAINFKKKFLSVINKLTEDFNLNKTPIILYEYNNANETFDKVVLDTTGFPVNEPCE